MTYNLLREREHASAMCLLKNILEGMMIQVRWNPIMVSCGNRGSGHYGTSTTCLVLPDDRLYRQSLMTIVVF